MNLLIVGSGGREDAFLWRLCNEEGVEKVFVSPGHGGMERFKKATIVGKLSVEETVEFCRKENIELVVIGPEAPLTIGLADSLRESGIAAFGPGREAAQLEGSKIFSKEFMKRHNIPTAQFEVYENYQEAVTGLKNWPVEKEGIVIKADGLAGGKGVVVTSDRKEAEHTLHDFMVNPEINVKSENILFEKVLPGDEVSVFAMANGLDYFIVGSACDHKRIGDNDTGPNTGGMGCYHDPLWPDPELKKKIEERILKPTLKGCLAEGMPYNGFLFMGLMVDKNNDPYVVEYNVRFGDPETQTLLPLIKGSFLKGMLSFIPEHLVENRPSCDLDLVAKASVHVVATSGGYPSLTGEPLDLGHVIEVPEDLMLEKGTDSDVYFFLAGVQQDPRKRGLLNSGGRVLGVTAIGNDRDDARAKAYANLEKVKFKGMYYRKDIALRQRGNKE